MQTIYLAAIMIAKTDLFINIVNHLRYCYNKFIRTFVARKIAAISQYLRTAIKTLISVASN